MKPFPMTLLLDVIDASINMSVSANDGHVLTNRTLNLVLRADHYAKIRLSSGEDINKVDIHFTISSEWRTPSDLDLAPNDVGFLCYSEGEYGKPFVGGGSIWLSEFLSEALLHHETIGGVSLTLSNVSVIPEYGVPFIWERDSENVLRISSVEVWARRTVPSLESEDD